jgi:hypothetical protein
MKILFHRHIMSKLKNALLFQLSWERGKANTNGVHLAQQW